MTTLQPHILPLQTMLLIASTLLCSVVSVFLELRKRFPQIKPTLNQILNLRLGDNALRRLVVGLLLCCVIDAYMTLEILFYGGQEINPIMEYFIQGNEGLFVFVKYAMTAGCVFLLVLHSQRQLLSVVSTVTVLKFFAIIYAVLVNYEVAGYLYFVTLSRHLPVPLDYYLSVLFV